MSSRSHVKKFLIGLPAAARVKWEEVSSMVRPSFELDAANAAAYLEARGIHARSASELGGGISNTVVLTDTDGGSLVLKQSLGKLRVADEWRSDRARVFREAESIRVLSRVLPRGSVPEVLFEDRPNYLFAMSAAPGEAVP